MEENTTNEEKKFRTLRGAITGHEPDEETYFAYTASLRIHGDNLPFKEITKRLGVQPTHAHRKGEKRGPRSPGYRDDAWHYSPNIDESRPLEEHIDSLWATLKPNADYIKSLKNHFKIDVFCGYRSNCDQAGVEVPHTSLEMFTTLEIPFGVSIIIT